MARCCCDTLLLLLLTGGRAAGQGEQATALVRDTWGRGWSGVHVAQFRARNIDPHGARLLILTFEDESMRARGVLRQMMRSDGAAHAERAGGGAGGGGVAAGGARVGAGGGSASFVPSASDSALISAVLKAGTRDGARSGAPKKPKALAHSLALEAHGDASDDGLGGGGARSDLAFCEGAMWWLQLIVASLSAVLLVSWTVAACFAWGGSARRGGGPRSSEAGGSPDADDGMVVDEEAHEQPRVLSHASSRMARFRKQGHL